MSAGRTAVLAAALWAAMPARGSAETRPRYAGAVTASLLGAPGALDPVAARSHAEVSLVRLLFDGLYRLDAQGAVVPQLAAALPQLDGARGVVAIPLRSAAFHDGAPITPGAVVASLERVRGAGLEWILGGATAITAVEGAIELRGVRDLETLARRLALPQAAIVPAQPVRGEAVIGSGPYSLAALRRREREVRLAPFAAYHAGRPYLDELVLSWFHTPEGEARRFELGNAHVSLRGVAAFAGAEPKYRAAIIDGPATVLVYAGFGDAHPELTRSRALRTALDLALARGAFSTLGAGEQIIPTRTPVPPSAGGAPLSPQARAGDLPAALAQLAAAAAANPRLTPASLAAARLDILFDESRPDDREVAERVVRALDKLGIHGAVVAVSAVDLRARVERGDCDLWIGQLAAPAADAAAWQHLALALAPRRGRARARVADPTRRFQAELPVLPLYFRAVRASVRTDLRGLQFDSSGALTFEDGFLFGEPERSRRGGP